MLGQEELDRTVLHGRKARLPLGDRLTMIRDDDGFPAPHPLATAAALALAGAGNFR